MKKFLATAVMALAMAGIAAPVTAGPAFLDKIYENGEPIKAKPGELRDMIEFRHARGFTQKEFVDLNGKKVKPAGFAGKLVIVDVWATWCEPCIRTLPAMVKLQKRYNTPESDIRFVSIAFDKKAKTVQRFLKRQGYEGFNTLLDPKMELSQDLPTDVIPTFFVLDGKGALVGFIRGYADWGSEAIHPYLRALADKYAKRDGDIVN